MTQKPKVSGMLKQISYVITLSMALSACGGSGGGDSKNSSSSNLSSQTAVSSALAVSSSSITISSSSIFSSDQSSILAVSSSSADSSNQSSSSVTSSTSSSLSSASSIVISTNSSSSTSSIVPSSSFSSTLSSRSSSSLSSIMISSSSSSMSSNANILNIDMTSGWRGYYGGEIAYSNEGVTLSATGNGEGAVFDVLKPTKLEGAVLEMVVNVSDELFINGVSLQPFAQINGGTYHGEFNCWVHFSTLFPGMDQTITCTLDEVDKFDQTEYDVQMGVRAAGGTTYFSGTLLIKSATITLASVSASSSSSTANSSSSSSIVSSLSSSSVVDSSSSIVSSLSSSSVVDSSSSIVSSSSSAQAIVTPDFEADSPGATYGGAAWRMEDITATVVSLASVTGLPANGSSTNVLKVVIKEYNAAPIVFISIQDGKTLADYVVKVDAYFPRNTLGNSGSGSNYYKEFLFLADNTISSAAVDTEAAYQGKQNTIWSDVDVWKTFTFTPDATKAASLTGTIQIALGINRPPGDDVDAYFLDNIRLELKP